MIDLTCVNCGHEFQVGDYAAGRRAGCPECKTTNPVPTEDDADLADSATNLKPASRFPRNPLIFKFVVGAAFVAGLAGLAFFLGSHWPGRTTQQTTQQTTQHPPAFDPTDAGRTFAWIIQQSLPVQAAGQVGLQEEVNNPLRTDAKAVFDQQTARWKSLLNGLVGKEVKWLGIIDSIKDDHVYIHCYPERAQADRIYVEAHYADNPEPLPSPHGRIPIGKRIKLEDAKRLNRGSRVQVHGTIEKIDDSVDGFSNNYVIINVKDTWIDLSDGFTP